MVHAKSEHDVDQLVARVVEDYFQRVKEGADPQLEEFIAQYPEISDLLRTVIPVLQAAERSPDVSDDGKVSHEPHKQLGDFRILRQIGRGGMGIVYEAVQISMNRRVALKVLPLAGLVDELKIRRFQNEVRAVAALDHPNIVPVYMVGEERGVHYFAMQLIRGRSLSEVISSLRHVRDEGEDFDGSSIGLITSMGSADDRAEPDLNATATFVGADSHREAGAEAVGTVANADSSTIPHASRREYYRSVAALGIQAASALQHAHEAGIVHRDVKPANLLLDGSAKLYVTDFGLARVESDAGVTMTGDLIGTLRYMAPEQALAKRVVIDHRADIYSLGVTLYELLTLRPAYLAEDRQQLLKQIAFEEPALLRRIDRDIPAELETIVHKAMAKEMDQRYASAQELADDLKSHLENRPIQAKPPTLSETIGKWTRRNPVLTWAAIVTLSLVTMTLVTSTLVIAGQRDDARKARRTAVQQREAARSAGQVADQARRQYAAQTVKMRRQIYLMHLANADRAFLQHDDLRGRIELDACPQEERGWEWHFLNARILTTVPVEFSGAEQPIFTLDGSRLVAVGLSGSPDENKALVWDVSTGRLVREFSDGDKSRRLANVALSFDEKWLVGGYFDGGLVLWNFETQQKMWSANESKDKFDGIAFSPDGSLIATANWDGKLTVFNATDGTVKFLLPFDRQLRKVSFSSDGRWLAVGINQMEFGETQVRSALLNVSTGTIAAEFPRDAGVPTFGPDQRTIVTGSQGTITFWDWDGQRLTNQKSWQVANRGLQSLDLSRDGARLASAAGPHVQVWDVETGAELASFDASDTAYWLSMSPGGDEVAVFTTPHGIRIWRLMGREASLSVSLDDAALSPVKFSPDGRRIAVGLKLGGLEHAARLPEAKAAVFVLESESGKRVQTLPGRFQGGSWMPDSARLVTFNEALNTHQMYDTLTGKLVRSFLPDHSDRAWPYVDATGNQLTSVSADHTIRTWDLDTGQLTHEFSYDREVPTSVAVAPRGQFVATAAHQDYDVKIWDVLAKRLVATLPTPGRWPCSMVFNDDGSRLYVGSDGGVLSMFDTHSGEEMSRFTGHIGAVGAVALSPTGKYIVASDGDRMIIWDVESTQPLVTLVDRSEDRHTASDSDLDNQGKKVYTTSLDWSSDNCRIVAGYSDGTLQIWKLQSPPASTISP